MIAPERFLPVVAVLGAVIGSFLNVVIYRLPRGLSIHQPRWSFCPFCGQTIRWYDNLPVVGWLALRGRCRQCRATIAITYPLVECLTALLFVSVWDVLFVGKLLPPIGTTISPLTVEWPVAIVYFALFAGLLALSGMDLEAYTINIEVCIFVMLVAAPCYSLAAALRNVSGIGGLPIPTPLPPLLGVTAIAMGAAWAATAGIKATIFRRTSDVTGQLDSEAPHQTPDEALEESAPSESPTKPRFQPLPILALAGLTVGVAAWEMFWPSTAVVNRLDPAIQRGILVTAILFLVLILCSMVHREADHLIIEEIEAERSSARGAALRELASFLPAIAVGGLVFYALRGSSAAHEDWITWTGRSLGTGWPNAAIAGAMASIAACVWAAALGWTVRILGTLSFGKEAFGSGDIYILGAIGAGGGLWFTVFGFFFAVGLALLGVAATAFHKRSRAIPFGPWLAIGAFFGLFALAQFQTLFSPAAGLIWSTLSGVPSD